MDDSDSDSSVERVLNKNYSFLRNSLITKDSISNDPCTTSQAVLENGQDEQQKVTDTKTTDKVNELRSSRYDNLTLEELNSIAERIKIYHEVGVVVPEKIVPCQNKYKRNNRKKPQRMQQSIRKRKTTFGRGRIGTACSAFGVRQCMCCNVDKENFSTVGEQNARLFSENCNSSDEGFSNNELTQCQRETTCSHEDQEPNLPIRTEHKRPKTRSSVDSIEPVTKSASTMPQLRGRPVQKTVDSGEAPLCESELVGVVTSTPVNIHRSRHLKGINSCDNLLDISEIETANTEEDVEESYGTSEIVQNKRDGEAEREDQIMEFVNGLLGTTANTIEEEVEERYQRLDESRRAASDAISNAISSNHDAVHEEMDLEPSVILVSVDSPKPILIEDSISEINELDSTYNDVEIVEETVTSTGVRSGEIGMNSASCSNGTKTCPNVEVVKITSERKKQTSQGSTALRECSICFESLANREISATVCGHVFCTECIKVAIRTSRMCPNCRTKLTLKKIHPLYL